MLRAKRIVAKNQHFDSDMEQVFTLVLNLVLLVKFAISLPSEIITGSEPEVLKANRHNHTLVFAHIVSKQQMM